MTTMEPPAKLQKTNAAAQTRKGSAAAGLADAQLQAANIIVQFRSDDGQLTGPFQTACSPPPSVMLLHVWALRPAPCSKESTKCGI